MLITTGTGIILGPGSHRNERARYFVAAQRLQWRSEEAPLDTTQIVQAIDAEIERLSKARALLTGHTAPLKRTGALPGRKRCGMSAEGRARVAAAQRARWAKVKK
jgi:hypothetical protein